MGSAVLFQLTFYFYLSYLQQKKIRFNKINESQTNPKDYICTFIASLKSLSLKISQTSELRCYVNMAQQKYSNNKYYA